MAASDALPVARKNVAYRVQFGIYKNDGTLITGATGLDSEVSKDSAAFADCTSEATEIGSSGVYYLDLTSTEMNADVVSILVKSTSTGAVPVILTINPEEGGDIRVNATHLAGTAQTGRDIGASVLLSSGTGTGQVNLSNGRADANLTYIAGSVLNNTNPQIGVNVVQAAGNVWGSGAITNSCFAAGAINANVLAADTIGASELAADAVTEIAAAVLASVIESNNSITLKQAVDLILAACAGVTSSGGTVLKDPSGTATRITATVDGSNNRTAMTVTPSS
jgi:hypothetical protein